MLVAWWLANCWPVFVCLLIIHPQLCKTTYAIKNLLMIIPPQWQEVFTELKLNYKMMPWDVFMCWNSTYAMIWFTIEYCAALMKITAEKEMKLYTYEIDNYVLMVHIPYIRYVRGKSSMDGCS